MFKEFKEFAMGGNVVDMAVGIVIGAAFGTIVTSLVADVIMPPIGLLLGGVDFSNLFYVIKEGASAGPYGTVAAAAEAGAVTINWGNFVNTLISFIVIAFAIFMLVRGINKMRKTQEEAPAEPSSEEKLLSEIRNLMKAQTRIQAAELSRKTGGSKRAT